MRGTMASELRWEVLFDTGTDGVTTVSAGAEFRNDSSQLIHIREITWANSLETGANDENGLAEISKSPVLAVETANNVFFTLPTFLGVSAGTTGTGAQDVTFFTNGGRKYGRGQLTLEPNESLFVNIKKTSGGKVNARFSLGYHF